MFLGKYDVKLDAKNRVIVPQRLRESHKAGNPSWSTFYLTYGAEKCISVYSPEGWERVMAALQSNRAFATRNMALVQRLIGAGADPRECDGEGRIILSDHLRAHAGIKRDVVWVGAMDRAEIWDRESWTQYQSSHMSELSEQIDLLAQLGMSLPSTPAGSDPVARGPES